METNKPTREQLLIEKERADEAYWDAADQLGEIALWRAEIMNQLAEISNE